MAAGGELLNLIPAKERPFVMFAPRSFMPQQTRQQTVNRLLGEYLVLLMEELEVEAGQQQQASDGLQPSGVYRWQLCMLAFVATG